MPEYISATAASRRYHVNERTVYRWIKRGQVPAKEVHINGLRQWQISVDDIEAFLAERDTTLPDTTTTHIVRRLETLEARVTELEHELHALQQQPARITPQREIEPQYDQPLDPSAHHDLPPGTLHIQDFLARHKLKAYRRRIIGYLDAPKNGLHFFAEQKPNRPDETDRYLTPRQQEELLTWLRTWHADLFSTSDLFDIR